MARTTFETLKVFWLPTVANMAAPTQAELTAGDELSGEIPVDGVEKGGSANNASQAMLGDAFVAEEPGTWGRTLTVTFLYDTASPAVAWTTFGYRTSGYFIFAPLGSTIATAKVEVWKCTSHERQLLPSAENEYQKFTVTFAVTAAPELDAVMAA
jgi:hypothetical protein